MRNRYVEMSAGSQVLWRGTSYKQAVSIRCNKRLNYWGGRKVRIADVVCTTQRPMGMQIKSAGGSL